MEHLSWLRIDCCLLLFLLLPILPNSSTFRFSVSLLIFNNRNILLVKTLKNLIRKASSTEALHTQRISHKRLLKLNISQFQDPHACNLPILFLALLPLHFVSGSQKASSIFRKSLKSLVLHFHRPLSCSPSVSSYVTFIHCTYRKGRYQYLYSEWGHLHPNRLKKEFPRDFMSSNWLVQDVSMFLDFKYCVCTMRQQMSISKSSHPYLLP